MYNWENSKSKSKSKNKYGHEYDPKNPTLSSSFLNKFNKPLKTHRPKTLQTKTNPEEDFFKPKTTKTKNRVSSTVTQTATLKDEKMSSLRRACLVEKWMEKKVSDKVISRGERKSSSRSSSTTLLEEFDLQDALFCSSTTTTTTSSSSSPSETEYSVSSHPKQKPRVTCFAPPKPKPIKTRTIESKYINQLGEEREEQSMSSRSRAASFYSNLKNLKQPISPGVKLTSFINSLFAKDGKKKCSNFAKHNITTTEETTTSYSCSSATSFSRSCLMSKNKRFQDDGVKRTVRFCPVSVIVDDDSQACGYKSLREEKGDRLMNSNFGRSLSKRYEELRKLNGLERESDKLQQQKKLEEVALDLLSGYWDTRLNKSNDFTSKIKVNDDDYGVKHAVNYDQHDQDEVDNDDDGFSCSSSDLFELDHLSLIGNELPVYETTQFDT